jgi:hypothetical protein
VDPEDEDTDDVDAEQERAAERDDSGGDGVTPKVAPLAAHRPAEGDAGAEAPRGGAGPAVPTSPPNERER